MRVDDFVLLGRTVPEESKKYGHRVCCAGYSRELRQLLRVYPLPVQNRLKQWNQLTAELERPGDDSRVESWAVKGRSLENVTALCDVNRREFRHVLEDLVSPSIFALNEQRRSLGIVRPVDISAGFMDRRCCSHPFQRRLFDADDHHFGAKAIDIIPVLRFDDEHGEHLLQVRELGVYEFLRKHRENASQVWQNLRIGNGDYEHLLLVGNMNRFRNAWLVISIFAYRRSPIAITLPGF
jgi:hypothetical protein